MPSENKESRCKIIPEFLTLSLDSLQPTHALCYRVHDDIQSP